MKIQTFTIVAGTAACNAKCPYCVSKMTPHQGVGFEKPVVNWLNFDKACRLAQISNVSTVLITGKGEPTLYPEQITEFLKRLKKFDFPLIEIQTNALSFGKDFKKYEKHLKQWRELGLNTIAISFVSDKKEENKKIYTPDSDYIDLEDTIKKLHNLGFSIRLSCIMLKGVMDSVEKVKKLAENAKKWNVEQLTVRSVKASDYSEDSDVYKYAKEHELSDGQILDIGKFLEKNAKKLMTLDHGAVVYDLDGQNICITDCLTIKSNTEELRQLIFFPDGHLRYDWRYAGAVII
ncbi:MAG: radical SAM protein [Nanoarchaeota archaeon]|nr:radical SAM protein [Nanoarchaeota archaeon]